MGIKRWANESKPQLLIFWFQMPTLHIVVYIAI